MIRFFPGSVINQKCDALLRQKAVVITTNRKDIPIRLQVLGVDHLARLRTFSPETCRDILFLRRRSVRAFTKDSHGVCPEVAH